MQLFMNNLIMIGLGSNLGDCRQNLNNAINRMTGIFAVTVNQSSVYRSEPVELTEQPWFFNQVIAFKLNLAIGPTALLQKLKAIESDLGRTPGLRYGPRIIDLDLLFYQNWVYESEGLSIPHPKVEQRSFVLQPLLEIAPDLINPRTGRTIRAIWEANRSKLSYCERVADLPEQP
jgi:2-amino-4-hydroxy-6-hydroxymethyldihydropteridine diphosphokinase